MPNVKPGDKIKVKTTFKNTGNVKHTFQIGCTMRQTMQGKDYDIPLESNTEGAGGTGSQTFDWVIPSNALKGDYDVITAVWEGKVGTTPFNRLDTDTRTAVFRVI